MQLPENSFYDPDLHLFVDDKEIFASDRLWPKAHTLRKDSLQPVLAPDGAEEGTNMGYTTVIWDREHEKFKAWYVPFLRNEGKLAQPIHGAWSADGYAWSKYGRLQAAAETGSCNNMHVAYPSKHLHAWFNGARFVATAYLSPPSNQLDPGTSPDGPKAIASDFSLIDPGGPESAAAGFPVSVRGIYVMKSVDGIHWDTFGQAVLPCVGDRSALVYDESREVYMFTSRPPFLITKKYGIADTSRCRKVALWESRDLMHFTYKGIILSPDEHDHEYTQIYGMVPFRYGSLYIGLAEMYHAHVERLDTELAFSRDGREWQRMKRREPVLAAGGEGSWDSHWVVPTLNAPFIAEDRLLFFYNGTSTKHASGLRHRRATGIASLRRDGWVSLEAGRQEGVLLTVPLPLHRPMRLEVNISCPTGHFSVEVITLGGDVISGYEAENSRVEAVDHVKYPISWKGLEEVYDENVEACMLRFRMSQGSFFAYRWVRSI